MIKFSVHNQVLLSLSLVQYEINLVIGGWGISYDIALGWLSLDLTDDKSMLVQIKAWCRLAASHYLSQCWPRSVLKYHITRLQWVEYSSDVTKVKKKTLAHILNSIKTPQSSLLQMSYGVSSWVTILVKNYAVITCNCFVFWIGKCVLLLCESWMDIFCPFNNISTTVSCLVIYYSSLYICFFCTLFHIL